MRWYTIFSLCLAVATSAPSHSSWSDSSSFRDRNDLYVAPLINSEPLSSKHDDVTLWRTGDNGVRDENQDPGLLIIPGSMIKKQDDVDNMQDMYAVPINSLSYENSLDAVNYFLSRLHEEERGRSSSSGRSKRFRREQQSPSLDSLRRSPDSRNDHPIDGRRIQRWWWMINSFRRHNSPDSKRPNDVKCKKHEKKTAKSYVNVRNHSQLNRRVDRRSDRRDNRRNEMSFDRRDNRRDGRQELRRDNRRDDWRDNRRDDRRSSRSHDRLDDRRSNKQDSMPYSHRRHRLSQDDMRRVDEDSTEESVKRHDRADEDVSSEVVRRHNRADEDVSSEWVRSSDRADEDLSGELMRHQDRVDEEATSELSRVRRRRDFDMNANSELD